MRMDAEEVVRKQRCLREGFAVVILGEASQLRLDGRGCLHQPQVSTSSYQRAVGRQARQTTRMSGGSGRESTLWRSVRRVEEEEEESLADWAAAAVTVDDGL